MKLLGLDITATPSTHTTSTIAAIIRSFQAAVIQRRNPITKFFVRPAGYYDGACSHSIVNCLDLLHDIKRLHKPSYIAGVGGRIALTHSGLLSFLPVTEGMNIAYYSKDAPTNLLSLGHLQRCGAFYSPDPDRPPYVLHPTSISTWASVGHRAAIQQQPLASRLCCADQNIVIVLHADAAAAAPPYHPTC